ncbi:hypothetical protein TOPH_02848 [Tolypocladium ophioglossoides CBS 100239]|uniref:Uncharacterized protein n=1 Tax=Tolypocladium ophioglossoides (strain CBS 100239) TaxID=1163406 RepID=A0A0L0NG72_TOLOC|nr:hypothetical protein TOPH_02848 [Tolypocladium ophioglossoides CBS 100239]
MRESTSLDPLRRSKATPLLELRSEEDGNPPARGTQGHREVAQGTVGSSARGDRVRPAPSRHPQPPERR